MTVTCLFCSQNYSTSQDFADHVYVCRWFRLARGSLRTMSETRTPDPRQPQHEPGTDPQPEHGNDPERQHPEVDPTAPQPEQQPELDPDEQQQNEPKQYENQ